MIVAVQWHGMYAGGVAVRVVRSRGGNVVGTLRTSSSSSIIGTNVPYINCSLVAQGGTIQALRCVGTVWMLGGVAVRGYGRVARGEGASARKRDALVGIQSILMPH